MVIRERFYTVDDLWELSHQIEYVDKRLELSEGMLIEMSPAGGKHGMLALRLGRLIGNYVEAHHLGETTAAETGYILGKRADGKDTVRAPDVGFISAARVPENGLPDGYIPFAPDLAVEVVSPNDDAEDIHHKVNQFLKAGTRLVWVAYPKTQSVVVHTAQASHTLELDATLDGADVLPGFSLTVKAIFES